MYFRHRKLNMRIFSLMLILAGSASYGAEPDLQFDPIFKDRVKIYEDPSTNDGWFARAEIHNVRGMYNETETDPTSLGDIQIQYVTSRPSQVNDINSADSACVVSLPEGVVAIPECVSILEQETENIYLYKYLGG